ncbi:MAG: ATP-grasp domain-containing protein [Anaerolineae bacterium]
MFSAEVQAVQELGLDFALISFEELIAGNLARAVRTVPQTAAVGIYRGWMLRPHSYEQFYEALVARGIHLVNEPAAYKHTHYLPESYHLIESLTPKSIWQSIDPNVELTDVLQALKTFGNKPVIVKDFVKSQKHHWNEACFIPDASNIAVAKQIVKRFIELQGDDLNEGLVFREYIEFESLINHDKSGMPLSKEFRIFYLDGEPVFYVEYWEQGDYKSLTPPLGEFGDIAKSIHSRFFTMDVAKTVAGQWMIVELGDAQVAGLPEKADAVEFYRALSNRLKTNGY